MTHQTDKHAINHVRRTDRAVEDEGWIKQMLRDTAVASIATVAGDQPFINSNLFVYDEAEHAIYFHTARKGRTRDNVEQGENVCVSIFSMGRLLPAEVALEFSVEYAGVVVYGRGRIVEDEAEATHFLQLLLDKYAPHLTAGVDYRPPVPAELKRTSTYRIDIESWSGKRKQVADDFPGAYLFQDVVQASASPDQP